MVNPDHRHLMRLDRLSDAAVEILSPSFNNLPTTNHKDGQYRLRRYSQVELLMEIPPHWNPHHAAVKILSSSTFEQGSEYNSFQGNIKRKFENLEDSTIHSGGMKELIHLFRDVNRLPHGTTIDIHQMRIITAEEDTQVSPEGVHRDGYDFIAMVGISRHNITGGNLLVYSDRNGDYFLSIPLGAGEVVNLDDSKLWHNASTIKPVDQQKMGYMDAFILTAKLHKEI